MLVLIFIICLIARPIATTFKLKQSIATAIQLTASIVIAVKLKLPSATTPSFINFDEARAGSLDLEYVGQL